MDMADKAVLYSYLCFFRGFGEVGAAKPDVVRLSEGASAAFRRLCVETFLYAPAGSFSSQPPSGGCVLKHISKIKRRLPDFSAAFRRLCVETQSACSIAKGWRQPPSGGCVLKQNLRLTSSWAYGQPPSGGCVLKPHSFGQCHHLDLSRLQAAVC